MSVPARRLQTGLALAVVACVVVALTALVMLPAAWLAPRLADATDGRLSLRDVEGSLWAGSGRLFLGAPNDSQAGMPLPGRLGWDARAASLLSGQLEVLVSDPELLQQPVRLVLGRNSIELGEGQLNVPLQLLSGLGAPFNTLDFVGQAVCNWTGWRVEAKRASGHAEMRLIDIATPLSAVRPLGSYRISLDGAANQIEIAVDTQHGPLILSAVGHVSASGMTVQGRAHAEPGSEDRLADLLSVLGRQEVGGVAFSFETSN
jgi:general secretion pathway protein N